MDREEKAALRYGTMFPGYPDALTPRQVQEMLGVGQRITYRLLREGKIPSVRMGRLYRVPKSAVIDYLYSGERRNGARPEESQSGRWKEEIS